MKAGAMSIVVEAVW
jgi:hypothetical protein